MPKYNVCEILADGTMYNSRVIESDFPNWAATKYAQEVEAKSDCKVRVLEFIEPQEFLYDVKVNAIYEAHKVE